MPGYEPSDADLIADPVGSFFRKINEQPLRIPSLLEEMIKRADRAEQLCLQLAHIIESHGYRIPSAYLGALAEIRNNQANEAANRRDET